MEKIISAEDNEIVKIFEENGLNPWTYAPSALNKLIKSVKQYHSAQQTCDVDEAIKAEANKRFPENFKLQQLNIGAVARAAFEEGGGFGAYLRQKPVDWESLYREFFIKYSPIFSFNETQREVFDWFRTRIGSAGDAVEFAEWYHKYKKSVEKPLSTLDDRTAEQLYQTFLTNKSK